MPGRRIISTRQIFGGYTFLIFRRNDALRAIDLNGDGQFTGAEKGHAFSTYHRPQTPLHKD